MPTSGDGRDGFAIDAAVVQPRCGKLIDRLPKVRGRLTEGSLLSAVTWFRVGGPAEVLFKPADVADLALFLGVGLHGRHGVEDFASDGRCVGNAVLRVPRQPPHAAAEREPARRCRACFWLNRMTVGRASIW